MGSYPSAVLPGDAFFLIRPTPVEAQAMRIAAMPLTAEFGGTVADEFHLTVQRAREIAPGAWAPLLGDLHRSLQGLSPFRLEAVELWRFYSHFRQSQSLFWTMKSSEPLLTLRRSLDTVLEKHGATLYPWQLQDWKPHTLAVHNVPGEPGDLPLPPEMPHPSFTVNELWLSIYQPWGAFVEHPVVIFSRNE
jgi:hypothetical protein